MVKIFYRKINKKISVVMGPISHYNKNKFFVNESRYIKTIDIIGKNVIISFANSSQGIMDMGLFVGPRYAVSFCSKAQSESSFELEIEE